MKQSNYDRMRDQMESEFLKYDQERMAARYGLRKDPTYLYLDFIGRAYRVNRESGRVEWSADGFLTTVHAGYNETMTIFDVLCYAKEGCRLSGRFVPVDQLKGTVQASSVGEPLFKEAAGSSTGQACSPRPVSFWAERGSPSGTFPTGFQSLTSFRSSCSSGTPTRNSGRSSSSCGTKTSCPTCITRPPGLPPHTCGSGWPDSWNCK